MDNKKIQLSSPSSTNSRPQRTIQKKFANRSTQEKFLDERLIKEFVSTKALTFEEIELYIKRLQAQYEQEKESRNYFQLERDRLIIMRNSDNERLEKLKSELREAQYEISNLESKHKKELLHLKRKIRYLINEQNIHLNEYKFEFEAKNKQLYEEIMEEQNEYLAKMRVLSDEIAQEVLLKENMITNVITEYENRLSQQTQNGESTSHIYELVEKRFEEEKSQFSLLTRNFVHEITEIKNKQIQDLIKTHSKLFDDLRNYFKDLVNNSMMLNTSLQQKVDANQKRRKDAVSKLKSIEVCLAKKEEENEKLKNKNSILLRDSNYHNSDKNLFKARENEVLRLKQDFTKLDIKYETMLKQHENLKRENDYLVKNYEASSLIYQERLNNRFFILNRKNELLQNELDKFKKFINIFKLQSDYAFINEDTNPKKPKSINIFDNKSYNLSEIYHYFNASEDTIAKLKAQIKTLTKNNSFLVNYIKNKDNCILNDNLVENYNKIF